VYSEKPLSLHFYPLAAPFDSVRALLSGLTAGGDLTMFPGKSCGRLRP
jgi:hypothetical protein